MKGSDKGQPHTVVVVPGLAQYEGKMKAVDGQVTENAHFSTVAEGDYLDLLFKHHSQCQTDTENERTCESAQDGALRNLAHSTASAQNSGEDNPSNSLFDQSPTMGLSGSCDYTDGVSFYGVPPPRYSMISFRIAPSSTFGPSFNTSSAMTQSDNSTTQP